MSSNAHCNDDYPQTRVVGPLGVVHPSHQGIKKQGRYSTTLVVVASKVVFCRVLFFHIWDIFPDAVPVPDIFLLLEDLNTCS